jgi:hypothetical protein
LFPDAKFVHIHRNPYTVFQSTEHSYKVALRWWGLQKPDLSDLTSYIIRRYKAMYDIFFAEKELIPSDNFHEVSMEEVEGDPIGQMRTLYEKLHLPDFNVVEPVLWQYVESLGDYKKNKYPELPGELRCVISKAWERCFDEWHYSPNLSQN